jgi:hypothetical protein
MTNRVSFFSVGALVAVVVTATSGDSRAGVQPGGPANAFCTITPGTSFCDGSFAGFQQSSDPNANAGFTSGTGGNSFSAELNGQNFGCTVSSTLYPQVLATWPQLSSFRNGFFFVGWDPQGFCNALVIFNGSGY